MSKRERAANFGKWAEPIPEDRQCMRCGSFETKIEDDGRHHWFRGHGDYAGGYLCYSCNEKVYQREVISAHRRVWEKYYKCSILPWGQIHFINGDKTDIRIENMVLLRRGGSALLLKPRIPKDRRCMSCGGAEGHGDWTKRDGGYICNLCHTEERRADLKKAKHLEWIIIATGGESVA